MPAPPRIELALVPTPILKLERLSRRLGVEMYVKRDDLTGLIEAGGQVRKLEFLAAEALAQGADTLIACGRPESEMCRAVAAVAARLGCRAVMRPVKSITFLVGIGSEARVDHYFTQCRRCWMRDCAYRRAPAPTASRNPIDSSVING